MGAVDTGSAPALLDALNELGIADDAIWVLTDDRRDDFELPVEGGGLRGTVQRAIHSMGYELDLLRALRDELRPGRVLVRVDGMGDSRSSQAGRGGVLAARRFSCELPVPFHDRGHDPRIDALEVARGITGVENRLVSRTSSDQRPRCSTCQGVEEHELGRWTGPIRINPRAGASRAAARPFTDPAPRPSPAPPPAVAARAHCRSRLTLTPSDHRRRFSPWSAGLIGGSALPTSPEAPRPKTLRPRSVRQTRGCPSLPSALPPRRLYRTDRCRSMISRRTTEDTTWAGRPDDRPRLGHQADRWRRPHATRDDGQSAAQHRTHPLRHRPPPPLEHMPVGVRRQHDGRVAEQARDVPEREA